MPFYSFRKNKKTAAWGVLFLLCGALCPAYASSSHSRSFNSAYSKPKGRRKKLLILATTGMIGDAVEQITQGKVEVKRLMGPGVDPHSYTPRGPQTDLIRRADLIFYNGMGLEGTITHFLDKRPTSSYEVSKALEESEKLSDPNAKRGAKDPHIWHDVRLWIKVVRYIADVLIKKDPSHADFYRKNRDAYLRRLEKLDREIKAAIAAIAPQYKDKKPILVTTHDAFEYYAKRYGLEVRSLMGASMLSQPNLRERENLKNFIVENGIPTIFAEASLPPEIIDALVSDCIRSGHKVSRGMLYSDSLGEVDGEAGTYIKMMQINTWNITKGLKKR